MFKRVCVPPPLAVVSTIAIGDRGTSSDVGDRMGLERDGGENERSEEGMLVDRGFKGAFKVDPAAGCAKRRSIVWETC